MYTPNTPGMTGNYAQAVTTPKYDSKSPIPGAGGFQYMGGGSTP
jgi:hypothetical protein